MGEDLFALLVGESAGDELSDLVFFHLAEGLGPPFQVLDGGFGAGYLYFNFGMQNFDVGLNAHLVKQIVNINVRRMFFAGASDSLIDLPIKRQVYHRKCQISCVPGDRNDIGHCFLHITGHQ